MFFYLVMLGVIMGWVEQVYPGAELLVPDKRRSAETNPRPPAKSVSSIPDFYRRHVPCEPCPPAVAEAERVIRSRR